MTAPSAVVPSAAVSALRPASPALDPADLRALREGIGGEVLVAGDPGYDAARGVHNTHYGKTPAAIVRPADALDVARAVLAARELGLDLAVKSGGHSVAGFSTTDGLLVDMRTLNAVDIDPIRWVGSAQGGATAGEYTLAAHQHGMATPFGDTLSVGIGGITLGGGVGWLARKHGMTIDSLLEADLVLADGSLVTVNAESDPDLFWAIRGGGGNFGVATRFRFRLHAVDLVYGGALFLPLTRDVLRGLFEATLEAPDELTHITHVMPIPPIPGFPPELVGTPSIVMLPVFSGPVDQGEAALAPFRAFAPAYVDLLGVMPYPGMYQLTAEGEHPGPGIVRSSMHHEIPGDDVIDAILERHSSAPAFPGMAITQIRGLGGAMARVPAAATAFAHRDAAFMLSIIAGTAEEAYPQALAWVEAYQAELAAGSTGVYANFLGEEADRLRQAYPGATYERLVGVKRRVDPENLFRGNHNIRPS